MAAVLDRLSTICLGLPEASREDAPPHAGFKVRGRTFAWFMDDHHGDGVTGVSFKATPGLDASGDRFYRPAYTRAGWAALRLDRPDVDWGEVEDLVVASYVLVAPKRLVS